MFIVRTFHSQPHLQIAKCFVRAKFSRPLLRARVDLGRSEVDLRKVEIDLRRSLKTRPPQKFILRVDFVINHNSYFRFRSRSRSPRLFANRPSFVFVLNDLTSVQTGANFWISYIASLHSKNELLSKDLCQIPR